MGKIDFRLIRQLWMFLAVAEEQHFGRAARRLGMSQPPLTEQIKVLEQSLGLTLFERSRRGTSLSSAGAAILPAVQRFSRQVEQLERVVREVAAGQTAILHIGSITSAMLEVLPPLLEELRHAYPGLTVFLREIDSVDAVPMLESGELDLAFARLDSDVGADIVTQPLTRDRLAVALHVSHPLAALPRIPMRLLATESFVMSSRHVSPEYSDMLIGMCRIYGFSPRILYEVQSVTAQVAYVSCGQGVALVPSAMRKIAPPSVVVRPVKEKLLIIAAAMVWNRQRYNPLINAISERLRPGGKPFDSQVQSCLDESGSESGACILDDEDDTL